MTSCIELWCGLWLPVCMYHAIHYLWLHLLDIDVHGRGQYVHKGGFLHLRAGGRSVTSPRLPDICLHLSATLPPTEITSTAFQRNNVGWAVAGCNPQTLPQVICSLGQVTWFSKMWLVCPLGIMWSNAQGRKTVLCSTAKPLTVCQSLQL